ncbi:MAG: exodeoxyribonuclease VII large subunit [Henriciella sp.]|nr:exodeoxyribonuclease VII large subunit [Henriciella sp.]
MTDSQTTNLPEQTVSELSASLKRTIETAYDQVRVRGELGRVTIARSGHMYADLKDDKAVLNTIMWKGQVSRLPFQPEEGLEVVATGRLSTYPGRSNYQLIADMLRPAGAGALMALLEERKKKLAAEGLFDPAHKKLLPFLPHTIGVVTSATGAVIRDILHRVQDRFPVRVILWPTLVQGDTAASQIERAIRGFNALQGEDRPDVLIVGRGGGSIEDLWPFNEEAVVRAAFESEIPLISAVGHETDTTLIDYVSDARAPTPTGAAEIAVPVRADLTLALDDLEIRQKRALTRFTRRQGDRLKAARLPRPERLLAAKRQALDLSSARLAAGLQQATAKKRIAFVHAASGLRPEVLRTDLRRTRQALRDTAVRARPALRRYLDQRTQALNANGKLLETLSYQATLHRGYALVKSETGSLVRTARDASALQSAILTFVDGEIDVSIDGTPAKISKPKSRAKPKKKAASKPAAANKKNEQGSLF